MEDKIDRKNGFGRYLETNVFLNLKASLHYCKCVYNETVFQFTTKRVSGPILVGF